MSKIRKNKEILTCVKEVKWSSLGRNKINLKRLEMNILILEDLDYIREVLELELKDIACSLTFAANGYEGLSVSQSKKFDLIVSDIRMPGMDGFAFAIAYREKSSSPHIIFFSGEADGETYYHDKLQSIANCSYVEKNFEKLKSAIRTHL